MLSWNNNNIEKSEKVQNSNRLIHEGKLIRSIYLCIEGKSRFHEDFVLAWVANADRACFIFPEGLAAGPVAEVANQIFAMNVSSRRFLLDKTAIFFAVIAEWPDKLEEADSIVHHWVGQNKFTTSFAVKSELFSLPFFWVRIIFVWVESFGWRFFVHLWRKDANLRRKTFISFTHFIWTWLGWHGEYTLDSLCQANRLETFLTRVFPMRFHKLMLM